MSFGVGVGDLLSILTLAHKLRRDFVDAPRQFNSISRECVDTNIGHEPGTDVFRSSRVRGLANVLQDVDVQLLGHESNGRQQKQLGDLGHSCMMLWKNT
ncbi:hypothetical protein PDIG_07070 [Penicillium digitatum PHI26]|uniref:Uncharacterized protein n=2 Tax=Penicillium digitatum TaxID=36651 RepID=K9GCK5_PEND2|nr:hypothetical protein PDIP_11720 [Penicillium digitatum Pd1]EKV18834.1 hypothetical protein PDIG_07070 [Penicillium digitatum PHI26]EKV20944.1 hypothetical protein PDIP_11720 [Penicillium digitatum Pd1]